MMGPSHALSGAAAWLAGSWVADHVGYHQAPAQIAVGAAVCAGAALLPDLDVSGRVTTGQGGATVAHTFGWPTLVLAEVVEKVSLGVYQATRTGRDPHRTNGHRTLTHTLPFAAGAGAATWWGAAAGSRWVLLAILFVAFGLALRGLADGWATRVGWLWVSAVAGLGAYAAARYLPAAGTPRLLGFAVAAGCVVHLAGDIITRAGIPVFWPVPYRRRMWWMVGVPNGVAVECGGWVERVLLRGLFSLVAAGAAAGLVWSMSR